MKKNGIIGINAPTAVDSAPEDADIRVTAQAFLCRIQSLPSECLNKLFAIFRQMLNEFSLRSAPGRPLI